MKKEKVVLSFVAVLLGLLVSGGVFYFYQSTKVIRVDKPTTISAKATPTPSSKQSSAIFLSIDSPKDEIVVDKKILTVAGKTVKDATVVISTGIDDEVVPTAANGDFTTTVNLEDGENPIEITAIANTGEETKIIKTVTFSTENF